MNSPRVTRQLDNILNYFNDVKKQISSLKSEEEDIKEKIHELMDERGVDKLVGNDFVCTRSNRITTSIKKNNVPEDVWNTYATPTQFQTITLKKK